MNDKRKEPHPQTDSSRIEAVSCGFLKLTALNYINPQFCKTQSFSEFFVNTQGHGLSWRGKCRNEGGMCVHSVHKTDVNPPPCRKSPCVEWCFTAGGKYNHKSHYVTGPGATTLAHTPSYRMIKYERAVAAPESTKSKAHLIWRSKTLFVLCTLGWLIFFPCSLLIKLRDQDIIDDIKTIFSICWLLVWRAVFFL